MKGLARKRNALLKKLGQHSEFVRGSISSVCTTCNRARCICNKTSSRRAYRLTYKDNLQKTRIVYVPREQLSRIRKMIANYARVRKIIEQLVETNIKMFKEEARR
jgi:intergrase/recombinase